MTTTSKLRGHPITWRGQQHRWVYADTGEPTVETWESRPCGHCGQHLTRDGHDPCLGTLPGVINACCGHGDPAASYVMFKNGITLRGFTIDTETTE